MSPFLDQVLEHDFRSKNEHREKQELLVLKKKKQDAYNKFVKEMMPVKISPRKNIEIQYNIQRLKHPSKQRKDTYDNYLDELRLRPHMDEEFQTPTVKR